MNPIIEKIFAHSNADNSLLLDWAEFINYALYDKEFGYYQKNKKRVGSGNDADFYTSVSLKQKVFSELIFESAKTFLAKENQDGDILKAIEALQEGKLSRAKLENHRKFGRFQTW